MRHHRLLASAAALLLLAPLFSCASEPDSAWGQFAGAWEESYQDSKALVGKHFLNCDPDDPYARDGGWSAQGDDAGELAGQVFFARRPPGDVRVPRHGEGRSEHAAGDFWAWMLDID